MLTLDDLQKTIDALTPTVYYVFSDYVTSGDVMQVRAIGSFPEFFVMRESDFEQFKSSMPPCNFVHFRYAPIVPELKIRAPELPQEYGGFEYRFSRAWWRG